MNFLCTLWRVAIITTLVTGYIYISNQTYLEQTESESE